MNIWASTSCEGNLEIWPILPRALKTVGCGIGFGFNDNVEALLPISEFVTPAASFTSSFVKLVVFLLFCYFETSTTGAVSYYLFILLTKLSLESAY